MTLLKTLIIVCVLLAGLRVSYGQSAGDDLIKFHKQHNSGAAVSIGGLVITGGGTFLAVTDGAPELLVILGVGGAMSVAGFIIMIDSFKYIKRAGEKMNDKQVFNNNIDFSYKTKYYAHK